MTKTKSKKPVAKKVARKAIAKKKVAKKAYRRIIITKSAGTVIFREDTKQTSFLIRAGRNGAANAINTSRALDLPIFYMENGTVVKEMPSGIKESVIEIHKSGAKKSGNSLKKGMIFHAKK